MQGKGFIKTLSILLLLIAVGQCTFMLPTMKVEKEADSYGESAAKAFTDPKEAKTAAKEARIKYLDSMSTEKIFSIPLLKDYTYDDLKKQQLALGLDLKGGQSAILQVDLRDFLVQLSENSKDVNFIKALDAASDAQKNSNSDFISLFGNAYNSIDGAGKLANIFMRNATMKEAININSSNGEVVRVLRNKGNETVKLTYQRLQNRIDKLGVVAPNFSLDPSRDLIIAELPGIENPERARNFLQASANLEFWNVYRITDNTISDALVKADDVLGSILAGDSVDLANINKIDYDTIWKPVLDKLGNKTDSTPEIVEKQKNLLDDKGPLFKIFNPNKMVSGGQQTFALSVMGTANKNQKSTVSKYLEIPEIKNLFPSDMKFLWSQKPKVDYATGNLTNEYELYMIRMEPNSDKAPLDGSAVVNANASPDPVSGQMQVSLRMSGQGSRIWADITTKAANDNNREVAIVLDDEVVSAPRVNSAITGGNSQITGNFSVEEAQDLSSILEVGKLPTKVQIIQESNVGPTLGAENIKRSYYSMIFGLLGILTFMAFYYSGGGIIAIIALIANIIFILSTLSSFGTVLTLPGIAGLVLTMGMAVDANVIIYERIREELADGKTLIIAISEGFKHSLSAILDANITTMIIGLVLFYFGLGPIKGFATVLLVGVVFTIFTAILLSRFITEYWTIDKSKNLSFWTSSSKKFIKDYSYKFIESRKISYIISGVLVLISLAAIFTKGLEYGVDFKGGYSYNVQFDPSIKINTEKIRNAVSKAFGESTIVKTIDTDNSLNIVTSYLINENGPSTSNLVLEKLTQGLNEAIGTNITPEEIVNPGADVKVKVISSSKVGATIADDIVRTALWATIVALILIFIYIFFRFKNVAYSMGAVLALAHDTIITLGAFSIFSGILPISLEIDQAFIAAILTIIGYSINDTVIVFDRIREFLSLDSNYDSNKLINKSLNTTLNRTVVTSLVTLISMVILLFFGGASIKGFAFALCIGIIVGTYSSVFIATPILIDFGGNLKMGETKPSNNNVVKKTKEAVN